MKMLKMIKNSLWLLALSLLIAPLTVMAGRMEAPRPLRIGYSIGIDSITSEKMRYAKSVGVDCIETNMAGIFDKRARTFKKSDEEIIAFVKQAKKAADEAGIEIWSIHMPFSEFMDLSLADETERQKVVALHKKILEFCRILQPKVILFHPSWFLGVNEREVRKSQMIKSAKELNKEVKKIGAIMVVENMLGPTLVLPGGKRERPLYRTVEEAVEMMNRLPKDIYSAIDMNHIKNPERLIRAMGSRLKSVHIADGSGEEENHYFPCSGKGQNNWAEILAALQEAHYSGPFMYESAYKDVSDMKPCYLSLYNAYTSSLAKGSSKK